MTERQRRPRKSLQQRKARHHDESEIEDPAWERQTWETPLAYQRFRAYRDMGPTRSLSRVAAVTGVGEDYAATLSRANQWVERCRRWESHMDAIGIKVQEDEARKQAALIQQRIADMREEEWAIWQAAKRGVLALIEQAVGIAVRGEDGKVVEYVAGDPKAGGAAAQLLREADRVARMATGQPTEGARPKSDEAGRDADIDAFLDSLSGGSAGSGAPAQRESD